MADFEMTIDGKKTKLTEKMAAAQSKREKKVPIEVGGRIVRVMPHMLDDMKKLGGTEQRRVIKEPPKELLLPLPKKLILPRAEKKPELLISEEIKPEVKEEPVIESYPGDEVKAVVETPEQTEPTTPAVKKTATRKPAAKKK